MRTIDGKYYVLDDAELKSAHQVRREKDSKNVLRCQCPLCSANRKKEHRKEKCVAVDNDEAGNGAREKLLRFVGFSEKTTDSGNVVQYLFEQADHSNWLISKSLQQQIEW